MAKKAFNSSRSNSTPGSQNAPPKEREPGTVNWGADGSGAGNSAH